MGNDVTRELMWEYNIGNLFTITVSVTSTFVLVQLYDGLSYVYVCSGASL